MIETHSSPEKHSVDIPRAACSRERASTVSSTFASRFCGIMTLYPMMRGLPPAEIDGRFPRHERSNTNKFCSPVTFTSANSRCSDISTRHDNVGELCSRCYFKICPLFDGYTRVICDSSLGKNSPSRKITARVSSQLP